MIIAMPPTRVFWPQTGALELNHGTMDMPRVGQTHVRSLAYAIPHTEAGVAEVHIEHWSANTASFSSVGKMEFGPHYGPYNTGRSSYINWLNQNTTEAVQYDHRRIRRFEKADATDEYGKSAVPDPAVKGDEIVEVKRDGAVFAVGLCIKTTTGTRIFWKQIDQMTAGPVYEWEVVGPANGLTAQAFIDNASSAPGHLPQVAFAYYEDVTHFPHGPGTGGANVPQD